MSLIVSSPKPDKDNAYLASFSSGSVEPAGIDGGGYNLASFSLSSGESAATSGRDSPAAGELSSKSGLAHSGVLVTCSVRWSNASGVPFLATQ